MALLLMFGTTAREGVLDGLQLCAAVLIPALYPFSVLARLLAQAEPPHARGLTGHWLRRLRLPGEAVTPLLLGILGGFPMGPQALATRYRAGNLSRADAVYLSPLCNQAGPAFLLGAVGQGIFGSGRIGLALWGINLASALLTGILTGTLRTGVIHRRKQVRAACERKTESRRPDSGTPSSASLLRALPAAMGDSAVTMVRICGTVVFCSALLRVLGQIPLCNRLPQGFRALLSGVLELTNGVRSLAGLELRFALPLCAALVGWGGICVHLQAADLLQAAGLPMGSYLRGKLLQGLLAGLLAVVCLPLFDNSGSGAVPVWSGIGGILLVFLIFFLFLQNIHWKSRRNVL